MLGAGAASAQSPIGDLTTEAEAQEIFAQVCVATYPTFAEATAKAFERGMQTPSRTEAGLYYHDRLNLSFKVLVLDGAPICSLVFGMAPGDATSPARFLPGALALLADEGWFHHGGDDVQTYITRPGASARVWGPSEVLPSLYNVMLIGGSAP